MRSFPCRAQAKRRMKEAGSSPRNTVGSVVSTVNGPVIAHRRASGEHGVAPFVGHTRTGPWRARFTASHGFAAARHRRRPRFAGLPTIGESGAESSKPWKSHSVWFVLFRGHSPASVVHGIRGRHGRGNCGREGLRRARPLQAFFGREKSTLTSQNSPRFVVTNAKSTSLVVRPRDPINRIHES